MKDIFKFIYWWWETLSESYKVAIGSVVFMVLLTSSMAVFGPKAIFTYLAGVALFLLYKVIRMLVSRTRARWIQFQMFQEREQEDIVRRLKG